MRRWARRSPPRRSILREGEDLHAVLGDGEEELIGFSIVHRLDAEGGEPAHARADRGDISAGARADHN